MTDHLTLRCARCGAEASWIVPRPHMLEMVLEIAANRGWRCDGDRAWCCEPAATATAGRQIGRRTLYTSRHIRLIAELRRQRRTWAGVAEVLSYEVGRRVSAHAASELWRTRKAEAA